MVATKAGKMQSNKSISQSGFTIIELLITVAVVAVVMAIAGPNFTLAISNSRVKTAASDIHADLMLARSEAIKRGADMDVANNGSGWDIKVASDSTILKSVNDLNSDITVECNTNGDPAPDTCPSSITFQRTGRLDASPFEFRFYSSSNADVSMRCVRLSLSGRPSVTMDTDGNTNDGCD